MTLLLIVSAWLVLMVLVAGLCRSARSGDADLVRERALGPPAVRVQAGPGFIASVQRPVAREVGSQPERGGVGVAA